MFGAKHDIKYRLFSWAIMIIEIWGLCTWVFEYCTQCTVHFLRVRSYSTMCGAACGAGMSSFAGELLHSHEYREKPYSARFGGKRVAVVGFGNSALDLAVELSHICLPARYTLQSTLQAITLKSNVRVPYIPRAFEEWQTIAARNIVSFSSRNKLTSTSCLPTCFCWINFPIFLDITMQFIIRILC